MLYKFGISIFIVVLGEIVCIWEIYLVNWVVFLLFKLFLFMEVIIIWESFNFFIVFVSCFGLVIFKGWGFFLKLIL